MPQNDSDFDILQDNVYNAASANAGKWLIADAFINALNAPRTRWTNAYTAFKNPALRTPAVTQEKNDAKKDYIAHLRIFIQGQLMHNPLVSNSDRLSIGLPVYDHTPTPVLPPSTRPEMEIDFSQILTHRVFARDSELKSAGKPKHVAGFELRRFIGGNVEPAIEDMQLIGQITRSPHILEYPSADRGQIAYYVSRWVSTRGDKGPWSEVVSATIP
jgi:hypothetical protein